MIRIGLYYGSFDPATTLQISFAVRKKKQLDLDEVWFVLSEEGNPYKHRMTLLRLRLNRKGYKVIREAELKKNQKDQYIDITDDSLSLKQLTYSDLKYLTTRQKRYIMEHYLYLESISKSTLKEHRWQHVQRVAGLCRQFAGGNGYDERKAYCAGMLHDIAKNMNRETLEGYMKTFCPEYIDRNWQVWHQYVGAVILQRELKMRDRKIIKAVRNHATGDDQDILSMIVYCADKLDPGRGYDSSQQIALCTKNITDGYKLVRKEQIEYLKKEGVI